MEEEFAIFFRRRGTLLIGGKDEVIEVDPVCGGEMVSSNYQAVGTKGS